MGKIFKGYELMKLIAEKKIEDGTRFRNKMESPMYDKRNIYVYKNNNFIGRFGGVNLIALMNNDFEILDEEQEVDIQGIEPLNEEIAYSNEFVITWNEKEKKIIKQQNLILEAVKQLDNKINKLESNT